MKFTNRTFINYEKLNLLPNVRHIIIYVVINGKPEPLNRYHAQIRSFRFVQKYYVKAKVNLFLNMSSRHLEAIVLNSCSFLTPG
jgi:hypothetical protein